MRKIKGKIGARLREKGGNRGLLDEHCDRKRDFSSVMRDVNGFQCANTKELKENLVVIRTKKDGLRICWTKVVIICWITVV